MATLLQQARITALGGAALAALLFLAGPATRRSAAAPAHQAQPALAAPAAESQAHPRLWSAQTDVYVVQNHERRWVASPQVFADYRFRPEWIEQVSDADLESIPLGPDLVAGPVLRAPDGTVWVVYQGTRRRVAGPDAWPPLALSAGDAAPVTDAQVQSYLIGRPVGNPPRPWMAALVAAALVFGAALVWWSGALARCPRLALAGIGLLAIAATALKLYYVTLYPWQPDGADAPAYVDAARYLASGGSILRDDPQGALISVTSPGYPMILALLSGAVSLAHGSVVGWKALQAGAATLLALMVADLARCLYGSRVALVAAVVALLSPLWLYSAELLQYELWYALLIATAVWALVRLSAAQRAGRRWLVLSGACYGALMLVQLKSLALLLPALSFLARQALAPRAPGCDCRCHLAGWGRLTLLLPLFVALSLAPIAAWGARNVALHGEPLLGSTGGGVMLWMGNHDGADGGYVQVPRPAEFYDRLQRYPPASITRDARAYADLALEYIAQHPSTAALLALTKLERFWWTIGPDRLGEFAEARMVAFLGGAVDVPALRLFSKLFEYGGIALAAAGLLWGHRLVAPGPAASGRRLIYASILAFWLVHAPFIVEPRYRLPIAPLLQALEAAGLVLLLDALPFRHRERDA